MVLKLDQFLLPIVVFPSHLHCCTWGLKGADGQTGPIMPLLPLNVLEAGGRRVPSFCKNAQDKIWLLLPPRNAMALGLMGVVEAGTVLGGETVKVYHIPCS